MARPERPVDPEAGPVQRLAYELRQLRLAAGRPSYRQLSTRAHFSASMLSEAAGGTVLPSLAVTLAYVKACGGDPEEWERRWRVAAEVTSVPGVGEAAARAGTLTPAIGSGRSGPSLGPTASATPMEATPPVEAHFVSPVATREGPSKRRSTRGRIMRLVAMTTVLTIVMTSMVTASHRPDNRLSKAAGQWIPGPAWANAPDRLPSKFFGVTLNSNSGAMPTFDVGAVRLWDSRTRWSNIEARRGEYNWFILDRMVAGATQAGLPVLLTFGGTPEWASPDGPRTPYDDGSRTSPPHDLSDWDRFVAAVAARYQGRIEAYELWNYANSKHFYSGSTATLVEMVQRAARIIKAADPEARVGCPSFGDLWGSAGRDALQSFAAAGGYTHCDAAPIKLHARDPSGRPEEMIELADSIAKTMQRAGVGLPMWATGPSYNVPSAPPLDDETSGNYAPRFFLAGLYARYERMYFYNWGGRKIPLVLQAEGGPPTRAALRVEELRRWLAEARITSCGHGTADGLPSSVWQCRFVVGSERDERRAVIQWTDGGTATVTALRGALLIRRLDGETAPVRGGQAVRLDEQPVLVEYAVLTK